MASSGEATAPCGVPSLDSDHWPSSDTPAVSHFWISRNILRSCRGDLVGPHDGGIDHQIPVLPVSHQIGEDFVPHRRRRPPAEPFMHALVLAITFGEILPPHPRTQHPQNTIDELSVPNTFNRLTVQPQKRTGNRGYPLLPPNLGAQFP